MEVEPLAYVRRSVCGMLYSDDAGIVFKSTDDLANMTVVVTVFDSADLTVPETETETTLLPTLNKVLPAPPLVVDTAARGIYIQMMHFLYLGVVLSTQTPTFCQKLRTDPTCVAMLRSF